jgi:hypothetical protein
MDTDFEGGRPVRTTSHTSLRIFGIDITTKRGFCVFTVLLLYVLMITSVFTLMDNNKLFHVFLKNLKLFHAYEYNDYIVAEDYRNHTSTEE